MRARNGNKVVTNSANSPLPNGRSPVLRPLCGSGLGAGLTTRAGVGFVDDFGLGMGIFGRSLHKIERRTMQHSQRRFPKQARFDQKCARRQHRPLS